MTYRAEVLVDTDRVHGRIDPGIYGQFIEHIGRAIYGGVFEPGSPLADENGYRTDVLEAVNGLAPTSLRWPGGNFASGYHWRDGVGPASARPRRRDLAWSAVDDNSFGTEEFLAYCRMLGTEPYVNLNMGTGTLDEALQWLEYCNSDDSGIPEVELRRVGPHPAPHGVRIWGLGNEVYGWWQHGHTTAQAYGEQAREWAKLLRWTDPGIRLVAVGAPDPDWNWTVLRTAGRFLDHISLHFYWSGYEDPYHEIVSAPVAAETDIISTWGMCVAARKMYDVPTPITLAVDEWGVWTRTAPGAGGDKPRQARRRLMREGFSARTGVDTRFEEAYDLKDALAVASWIHVLWRHPEKVTLATQAQTVNVLAPIHTTPDGVVLHTVYHPLALARTQGGPLSLDVLVRTDTEVSAPKVSAESLPALDVGGTFDPATGRVHLSIVNRSRELECELDVRGLGSRARLIRLWDEDPFAGNSPESPNRVSLSEQQVELGSGPLVVPPHSHTTLLVES